MSPDPTGWTIGRFAEAYRTGATASDVIDAVLALLGELAPGVLIGDPLGELARADAAALATVDPATLPLYGVPFLAKDNIDVAGVPTTAGCPGFSTIPKQDATVVALLRAAGAIVVGKSNLDQFATGLVGTRSPYGTPTNVLDERLVPGGSSSGSAVAVALGVVPFALGTDTAGSGRVPAALNGIVGIKPTVGSASTRGIVPAVRRIDCPSVFARTVGDAAAVAAIIRQHDPLDPYSRRALTTRAPRRRMVIGVPRSWPASATLDGNATSAYEVALDSLRALGVELHEIDVTPMLAAGALLYGGPSVAERTAAVGDALDREVDGLNPVVTAVISRGHDFSAIDAYRNEYELARLRAEAAAIWDEVDVVALPTYPRAITLDEVRADPIGANDVLGRFTTFVNLLDLAAVIVPVPGHVAGLQLVAPAWQDAHLERLAAGFESGVLAEATQARTLVVVGAHLEGLALHHQLVERRASLVSRTRTLPEYRLYALRGTVPPKPGLLRVGPLEGAEIEVEVWSMGDAELGSFMALVPPPLCIGTVALSDGTEHRGFLCEPAGLEGAVDITAYGGWRAYLRSLS